MWVDWAQLDGSSAPRGIGCGCTHPAGSFSDVELVDRLTNVAGNWWWLLSGSSAGTIDRSALGFSFQFSHMARASRSTVWAPGRSNSSTREQKLRISQSPALEAVRGDFCCILSDEESHRASSEAGCKDGSPPLDEKSGKEFIAVFNSLQVFSP